MIIERKSLYKQVWETPLRVLAKEYGISDVALKKVCLKLKVPTPGRGYWRKRACGKPVPPRPNLTRTGAQSITRIVVRRREHIGWGIEGNAGVS